MNHRQTTLWRFVATATVVSALVGSFAVRAYAAPNTEINYQGKLTDSDNTAVADGAYKVRFRVYTVASGGTALFDETHSLAVSSGLFSAMLGSAGSSTADVDWSQNALYLGVEVSNDGEMTPRKRISSVPSAHFSLDSAKLQGLVASDFIATSTFSIPSIGSVGSTSATTTFPGYIDVSRLKIGSLSGLLKQVGAVVTTATAGVDYITSAFQNWELTDGYLAPTTTLPILINNATSTITNLSIVTSTSTNATSTYTHISTLLTGALARITDAIFTNATTTNATSTNHYISGQLALASLAGPLQAISGVVSASSTLSVAYGGTGANTFASNGILYGNGGTAIGATAAGTNNYLLYSNNGTPAWTNSPTILGTNITSLSADNISAGTLAVARGGTGQTSFGQGWLHSDGTTFTASTSPTVNYIVATSTTQASTFMYRVGIGTSTPAGLMDMYGSNIRSLFTNTYIDNYDPFSLNVDNGGLGGFEISLLQGTKRQALFFGDATLDTNTIFGVAVSSDSGVTWNPALAVNHSGKVGMGTTTPFAKLDVAGANNATAPLFQLSKVASFATTTQFIVTNAGLVGVGTTSPWATFAVNPVAGAASNQFVVGSSTATNFIVDNSGKVGIGTTTPLALLHISKDQDAQTIGEIISNLNTGTNAYAELQLRNVETVNDAFRFGVTGTGFTTLGGFFQDAGFISAEANLPNGMSLITRNANAPILFYTGGHTNQRMIIGNTGLVGIGTTTPQWLTQIASSSASVTFRPQLTLTDMGAGANAKHWNITSASGNFSIGTSSDTTFATSTYFTITNGGNVGIGTTSPWRTLSVTGSVAITAPTNSNTGDYLCWNTTTKEVTENATACSLSSIRWKENIRELEYGLNEVMRLHPIRYDLKPQYGSAKNQPGFIAEEALTVVPDLVSLDADGLPSGFDYPKLTAVLTKAMQEMNLRIETIASTTASSTIESRTFAESFFESVFARTRAWLADAKNGIGDFFAGRVRTKELCVRDDSGAETCITKTQLDALLSGGAEDSGGGGGNTTPAPTPTPASEPEPEATSTPEPEPAPAPPAENQENPEESPLEPEPTPTPTPPPPESASADEAPAPVETLPAS